jgi:hypothetical protein
VDFIQNDQSVFNTFKEQSRVFKASPIITVLKIEVDGVPGLPNLQGKRSFTNLTGTKQGYSSLSRQS